MKMWRKILTIVSAVALVTAGISAWPRHEVLAAATNSVYLSPSATSVQNGSTVVVSVRINPSAAITSATATVAYNASQLQYVSADTSQSAFSIQFTQSQSSGSVAIERGANLGTSVSADSLVETITFKALAGTGTTSLSLSNTTAGDASTGNTLTYSGIGTTLTLTTPVTPPPSCPAGTTGTYPNCTKPSTGGSTSKTTTTTTSGSTTNNSSGATTNTSASQPASQPPSSTPVTVSDKKVAYTSVSITVTSKDPTKVYIRYGVQGMLDMQTPVTDFGTSHVITLDPNMVLPGEAYSYAVVATNQKGITSQSQPDTFQTKGIQITVKVLDKNHKPLANKKITLHSNPQTATTDAHGLITFASVTPGTHHVMYSAGKQTYDQQINVTNTVRGSGETQTATPQSFSVVYNLTQSSLSIDWIWGGLAVIVLAVLAALWRTGHLGLGSQFRQDKGAPLMSAPIVVGGNSSGPQTIVNSPEPQTTEVQRQLSTIPEPNKPQPGVTVAPPNETDGTNTEVK